MARPSRSPSWIPASAFPYADQSRVFERFYRVDKSHSKEVGGTGLGLSIVKHAAQYHGAKLELKSDPGTRHSHRRQLYCPGIIICSF